MVLSAFVSRPLTFVCENFIEQPSAIYEFVCLIFEKKNSFFKKPNSLVNIRNILISTLFSFYNRIGFSIKIHLLILRAVDSYVNSKNFFSLL